MSAELALAIPEITLLLLASLVLVVDAFSNDPEHKLSYWLTQASLLLTLSLVLSIKPPVTQVIFHNSFISDAMSTVLKAFIWLNMSGMQF